MSHRRWQPGSQASGSVKVWETDRHRSLRNTLPRGAVAIHPTPNKVWEANRHRTLGNILRRVDGREGRARAPGRVTGMEKPFVDPPEGPAPSELEIVDLEVGTGPDEVPPGSWRHQL